MNNKTIFCCDFETIVEENTESQNKTAVWSSALVELNTEDVKIFNNITETLNYITGLKKDVLLYYHNLKFDGSFYINYLLKNNYKQAFVITDENTGAGYFKEEKEMLNNEFIYSISDKGQFYSLTLKVHNKIIDIRDSLKLLPFSLSDCGKAFKTKHRKTEMDYKSVKSLSECTEKDIEYIKNDVLVLKECVEFMYEKGHTKLTIGSCCKSEYLKIIKENKLNNLIDDKYGTPNNKEVLFPDLTKIKIRNKNENFDEWVRKSYRGGWCYVVKGKENKKFGKGTTADVNSLYPSMMSGESGNKYPVGKPFYYSIENGELVPNEMLQNKDKYYYFIHFTCRFKIKEGYLPFVQIKNNLMYDGTECLETSDIWDSRTKTYNPYFVDFDGKTKLATVNLTMTETDWELFKEHYNITNLKIHDVTYFHAETGIFDEYINRYRKIKEESTGAMRTLAKLFLNNLYGKLATSSDSSFKVAYIKEDESLGFYVVEEHKKDTWFIPCGSAITSYARNFTIRAAQKNYYGKDKRGFIYADTDSIHCDLEPDEFTGIRVHNTKFCCWKLETHWTESIFVRQKTYIEKVDKENLTENEIGIYTGEKVKNEKGYYYNVKCAGMPEKSKEIFIKSIENSLTEEQEEKYEIFLFKKDKNGNYNRAEKRYKDITDFKVGLELPCKLRPKQVDGGVLLVETSYKMR